MTWETAPTSGEHVSGRIRKNQDTKRPGKKNLPVFNVSVCIWIQRTLQKLPVRVGHGSVEEPGNI